MSIEKQTSRRDFLKTTTGASLIGGLSLARSAHAAGDDTLRVALVGCGGRGSGAAAQCMKVPDSIQLVAMADYFRFRALESRDRLLKDFAHRMDVPDERVFDGFDAYKKAIDCNVDMVVIATPPGFRPMHYQGAVEAGKHVFMEKPLCTDGPGFQSLMKTNELAEKKGLKVGVGLQRHHEAKYLETIPRIQDGAIGDLSFLRAYWNMGNIWARARKPGMTEMEYQVYNWQYFYYFGGDHIVEQHVHNLDVCNWIMDGHPVEANGMGGRQRRDGFPDMGHIYDHHFVEFTYANGVKLYSQCRQMPGCWNQVAELARGSDGMANASGEITGKNPWKWREPTPKPPNPYDQEHVDLNRAIRTNEKYHEGWYGATSTFTAVMGRMATYSGEKITWDEAVKAPSIFPKKLARDADPPFLPDPDGSYKSHVALPGIYDFKKQG